MDDFIWLAIIIGLSLLGLLYTRLLGDPGSESGAGREEPRP